MERLRASDVQWRMPDAERLALKLEWARKAVHSSNHLEQRFRDEAKDR